MPVASFDHHHTIEVRPREHWWRGPVSLGPDGFGGSHLLIAAVEALALDTIFEMTSGDLVAVIFGGLSACGPQPPVSSRLAKAAADAGTEPRTVLMCHLATALLPTPQTEVIDLPSSECSDG